LRKELTRKNKATKMLQESVVKAIREKNIATNTLQSHLTTSRSSRTDSIRPSSAPSYRRK
jgi:hypothetical protein